MDHFSKLNNIHVNSLPGSVWGIQKKRKTGDRKQQEREKGGGADDKKENDMKDAAAAEGNSESGKTGEQILEEDLGYSPTGARVKIKRKIDLII
jgi:hypothetical protein